MKEHLWSAVDHLLTHPLIKLLRRLFALAIETFIAAALMIITFRVVITIWP